MSIAFVTSPKYLAALFESATPPTRPSNLPRPPNALNGDDSANERAVKSFTAKMMQWEKQMIEINPEVGSDWERWFGKSELERDWNARPRETEEDGRFQPQSDGFLVDRWSPDIGRKTLWRGVMVISYVRDKEMVRCPLTAQRASRPTEQVLTKGKGVPRTMQIARSLSSVVAYSLQRRRSTPR